MKRGQRRTAVTLLAGLTALTVFSQTIFATEPAGRRIPGLQTEAAAVETPAEGDPAGKSPAEAAAAGEILTEETMDGDRSAAQVSARSSAEAGPSGRSEEGTAWHAEDGATEANVPDPASEGAEADDAGAGGWVQGMLKNVESAFGTFIDWVKGIGTYHDEEDAYRSYFGMVSGNDAAGRSADPDGSVRATSPDAARRLMASLSDAERTLLSTGSDADRLHGASSSGTKRLTQASASDANGKRATVSNADPDDDATPSDAFPADGPVFSEKSFLAALLKAPRKVPADDSTYPMIRREYREEDDTLSYLYYAWAQSLTETLVTGCELKLKNEVTEPDTPGTVNMYLYEASQDDPFCEDEQVAYTRMNCVKASPESTELSFRTDEEDGDLYWYYMTEEGLETLERQDDKTFRLSVSPEEEATVNMHRIPVGIIEDPDLITVEQIGGVHVATETELRKVEVYVNGLLVKEVEAYFPVDGHKDIDVRNQIDVYDVTDEYYYGDDYSYDLITKTYVINLWSFQYQLNYDPNGGTGLFEEQVFPESNMTTTDTFHEFIITTSVPERKGYSFLGWSVNETSKVAEYQPGESIILECRDGAGGEPGVTTGTLYAVWKRSSCTVSYEYTGTVPENAPPLPESRTVAYGAIISLEPEPSMTGYTFSGWSIGLDFIVKSDIVITGSWTIITHTVSRMVKCDDLPEPYVLYEAEGLENPQTLVYGAEITKTAASKENYDFDGWYTDPELTERLPEGTVITDQDVTLYGLFRRKKAPLVVRKTGLEDGESAIFTLTGPGLEQGLRLVVPGGGAVTVAELPVGGTFTIAEDHAWSCRYVPAEPEEVTIPEEGAEAVFHNTLDSGKEAWFFGETSVRNLFQGGKSG